MLNFVDFSEMGMGKTVMSISLILQQHKNNKYNQLQASDDELLNIDNNNQQKDTNNNDEIMDDDGTTYNNSTTLIVCPMSLVGQCMC